MPGKWKTKEARVNRGNANQLEKKNVTRVYFVIAPNDNIPVALLWIRLFNWKFGRLTYVWHCLKYLFRRIRPSGATINRL